MRKVYFNSLTYYVYYTPIRKTSPDKCVFSISNNQHKTDPLNYFQPQAIRMGGV